jgi:hypothetical protein
MTTPSLHVQLVELLNNYSYATIVTQLNAALIEMRDYYNRSYEEMLDMQRQPSVPPTNDMLTDIALLSKAIDISSKQPKKSTEELVVVEKAVPEEVERIINSAVTIKKRNNKKKIDIL